jgi:hypothetical protein
VSDLFTMAGFAAGNDGVLRIPGARVELVPVGGFYEVRITDGNGILITAVAHKSALKVTRDRAGAERRKNISDPSPAGVSVARLAADK